MVEQGLDKNGDQGGAKSRSKMLYQYEKRDRRDDLLVAGHVIAGA